MITQTFPILRYIFTKVNLELETEMKPSNFIENLQIANSCKSGSHYFLPIVYIDDEPYYDPNSDTVEVFYHLFDVILLLQRTGDAFGG